MNSKTDKQFKLLLYKIMNQNKIKKQLYRGKIFSKSGPTSLIHNLRYRITEIRNAWNRAKNGYARYEAYDIKSWFAVNITHMLHDMILDLHSYPSNMTYEEWRNILLEMYKCFKYSLNNNETDLDIDNEIDYNNLHKGLELFVKYFNDMWD